MFQYACLYAQAKAGYIPDTYVQSEDHFGEYSEEIKALYGGGIGSLDQVAIHVRRGKNPIHASEPAYSDNPFYVDLSKTDYYERAMEMFPNEKFLVFSDDIEWCKQQDLFKDWAFSEGNDEVTDMNLMASCKGVIMANSSYSWWAAYLSKGKVVAPKKWYSDGIERTELPANFIQI